MPQGAGRTAEDGPRAAQRWVLLHPEVPRAAQAVVNANAVQKSSGGDPEGIAGGDLIIPTSAMSLFCSRWLVCEGLKALLEAARSVPQSGARREGACGVQRVNRSTPRPITMSVTPKGSRSSVPAQTRWIKLRI